jgi:hypothetical protein
VKSKEEKHFLNSMRNEMFGTNKARSSIFTLAASSEQQRVLGSEGDAGLQSYQQSLLLANHKSPARL